ncbi:anaerobic ribonucleoside-triphosphate reductase activating protein [Candidatus Woesearchaeota archaeon]|nr:anaerobic ribonucleoside-triphosphate reductase activating protein [Candidatus Woesearchaeota archaeon]
MEIKGLDSRTFIDWEGKEAIELFLGRCNFRCPYCHNKELVNGEGKVYPVDDVLSYLESEKRKAWKEGVIISGGEPTIHKDLPDLIDKIKEIGFPVKLYTNGSKPEMLEKVIDKLDAVSMDAKAPLAIYKIVAGVEVDVAALRKSSEILKNKRGKSEFRVTCVPGYMALSMVRSIGTWLEGAEKLILQNFKPGNCLDPNYNNIGKFARKEMDDFKEAAEPYFDEVEVLYNDD